jgi:hydrogenase-4 component E
MPSSTAVWLEDLNALVGGFFLLALFGLVSTRQVQGCLRIFVILSGLLATSAFLLSALYGIWDLAVVGVVDVVTKVLVTPRLMRRALHREVFGRREVTQVLNVPTALLCALGLAIAAYMLARPVLPLATHGPAVASNLPVGVAGLLIGGLTAAVRREAVPLFLGLLAMENGAFFAGIGVAPEMPLLADVAIAFDVLILVFVVGILTRTVQERIGTTEVGTLTTLREGPA